MIVLLRFINSVRVRCVQKGREKLKCNGGTYLFLVMRANGDDDRLTSVIVF